MRPTPTPQTDAAEEYYDGPTGFVRIDDARRLERRAAAWAKSARLWRNTVQYQNKTIAEYEEDLTAATLAEREALKRVEEIAKLRSELARITAERDAPVAIGSGQPRALTHDMRDALAAVSPDNAATTIPRTDNQTNHCDAEPVKPLAGAKSARELEQELNGVRGLLADTHRLHAHCLRTLTANQVAHLFGDRMTEIVNDRDRLATENTTLRMLFPEILRALGNGSAASADCSMELLQSIPREVHLVVIRGRAEIERVTAERNRAVAELDDHTDAIACSHAIAAEHRVRKYQGELEKRIRALNDRCYQLESGIRNCLLENAHLADGVNCTLGGLKNLVGTSST
jgi:hypothetical protein